MNKAKFQVALSQVIASIDAYLIARADKLLMEEKENKNSTVIDAVNLPLPEPVKLNCSPSKVNHETLAQAKIEKRSNPTLEAKTESDEWHRSPSNSAKITDLLKHVYGEDITPMIAHHILYQEKNATEPREIPSAETLFFDREFLRGLFGANWSHYAMALAPLEQQKRLDYLHEWINRKPPVDGDGDGARVKSTWQDILAGSNEWTAYNAKQGQKEI